MRKLIVAALLLTAGCLETGTETESLPEIGDRYGGGIVLSTHQNTVLVISGQDISKSIPIACSNAGQADNQSANGWYNTRLLAEACSDEQTGTVVTWNLIREGYTDWFVPGREMLEFIQQRNDEMELNLDPIKYWSSARGTIDSGYDGPPKFVWIDFSDGTQGRSAYDSTFAVRPIRIDTLES